MFSEHLLHKTFSFSRISPLVWFLQVGLLYSRMSRLFIQTAILIYTPTSNKKGYLFYFSCKHLMLLLKQNKKLANLRVINWIWISLLLKLNIFLPCLLTTFFLLWAWMCGRVYYLFMSFTHSLTRSYLVFFLSSCKNSSYIQEYS